MLKKRYLFLILIICLFAISAASAEEIDNDTDISVNDYDSLLSESVDDGHEKLSDSEHIITPDNYNQYFSYSGKLIDSAVDVGDILTLTGSFASKNFVITKNITLQGINATINTGTITLYKGASGSVIRDLAINNIADYCPGVFIDGASYCTINNLSIVNKGVSSFPICINPDSNYNTITNNYVEAMDSHEGGSRSTYGIVLGGANNNYIANNEIYVADANGIYLNNYASDSFKGGLSFNNVIYNNSIIYTVNATSWGYAIQMIGGNNSAIGNKINGAYRGISSSNHPLNKAINNTINIKGYHFKTGALSGGDFAIYLANNATIYNNTITGLFTDAGIYALDNSIIDNNFINTSLGCGIEANGEGIQVTNNEIHTISSVGINQQGKYSGIIVDSNVIVSEEGIGIFLSKASKPKYFSNITITNNKINTSNEYIIEVDADKYSSVILNNTGTGKILVHYFSVIIDLSVNNTFVGYPVTFILNVTDSNNIPLNEGYIEFYVDNQFDIFPVNNGIVKIDYVFYEWGNHTFNAVFTGNDNFLDYKLESNIFVNKSDSVILIGDINGTVGRDVILTATVNSSNKLTINEGIVTFFDGETNIGESEVTNGVATLTYTPISDGEHSIFAIFDSDNYLSSNNTCKLFVDSATVEVLVSNGTVGFESNFIANVKGLYSIINEGTVSFYVGDEYLGKVSVVNGVANLTYTPLIAKDYVVRVVYGDSDHFLDDENSTGYTVNKADSSLIIDNLNGTVGHDVIITATVNSSNELTINEGTVSFFDDNTKIGDASVLDGKATLTYTPTTNGRHSINATYYSDNYHDSTNSSILTVAKANVNLNIEGINTVLYGNPSNFIVNVNSNSNKVNEGKVKFYVDNNEVGFANVENGVARLSYVAPIVGNYNLKAVFDESDNYFTSNATAVFDVIKMQTTLSGNSIIFDDDDTKTYTTVLLDDNNNGVYNKSVEILVIKYSGEYSTFNAVTDFNGISTYDINSLKGGMWYITGTFGGDDNYVNSSFVDKFIVVKIETTTNVEEISNPQVNYTYKLKANIHDADGKLVKEGIVQFYLDGVDIGSIDLSKHGSNQNNDLLGAFFDSILGDDEEGPYLEYTPTKAGNFTLSAVYEGTTLYKSSYYTTDFIVGEKTHDLSAPDVIKYYHGSERFVATLKDLNGNAISGADVKFTINGQTSTRTTDSNGIASMALNLNSDKYDVTTEYNGTKVYSTVTIKDTVIANDFTKIYKNGTQYNGIFVDSQGNLLRNTDVKFNINGVFYTRTTNDQGVARMNINLNPGTYVLTAENPASGELHTTTITVLTSIITYNLTKYYKNESKLTFKLLDNQGKPVGEGISATININGVLYTRQTNASGYVNMNINLSPGTYIATIEYNGLMMSSTVKVLPILSAKDVNMKFKDGSKFEVKLVNGQGKPLVNQKIIFNINGVFYDRTTDENGIARLNINLMPGEYIITSMYEPNGAALSNKVTVRS